MLKKTACCIVFLLVFLNFVSIASATEPITLIVDGQTISSDVSPQIINGRVMIPIRAVSESLGATVNWDTDTHTVDVIQGSTEVSLCTDGSALINQQPATLDVPPQIVDGRLLVPARFLFQAFGYDATWDDATDTVTITSPAAQESAQEAQTSDNELKLEAAIAAAQQKIANIKLSAQNQCDQITNNYDSVIQTLQNEEAQEESLFSGSALDSGQYQAIVAKYASGIQAAQSGEQQAINNVNQQAQSQINGIEPLLEQAEQMLQQLNSGQ